MPAQPVDFSECLGREVLFLAEVDRDVGLALQHDLGEVGDGMTQALGRRAGQRGGVDDGSERQLDGWLAQSRQQFDLAAKVRVDERLGDAEFGGDIVQRGAREAALIEEFYCLFEDSLTLVSQNFIAHGGVLAGNGLD